MCGAAHALQDAAAAAAVRGREITRQCGAGHPINTAQALQEAAAAAAVRGRKIAEQ